MNLFALFGVFIVYITSVRCYTETSNLHEDGCNHFRKLHGTTYAWSCEKTSFCPKQQTDLILKLHTLSELLCDSSDSSKICCPKTLLIGSTRAKRTLNHGYQVIPIPNYFDYVSRQQNTVAQAEIPRPTNTVANSIRSYSLSPRTNFDGVGPIVVTNYSPPVSQVPQNVYIDCKALDSSPTSSHFIWNCQKGPCKTEPQSHFVKRDYPCNSHDDTHICCPNFLNEITPTHTAPNNVTPGWRNHPETVDLKTKTTTESIPGNPSSSEQAVIFPKLDVKPPMLRPYPPTNSVQSTTFRPHPQTNFVQPTMTDGLASREVEEKRFTKFDHNLLSILSGDNPRKNVVISPASVKVLLALLAEGSSGNTSDEILNALQLKKTPEGQKFNPLRKFQSTFEGGDNSSIDLKSRSRIFVANNLNVQKDYNTTIRNHYHADVQKLDFSKSDQASRSINAWVNNSTHGLIPTIVEKDNFNKGMKLFLLNYVYLKAKWETEFNSSLTRPGCFYSVNNQCEKVHLMSDKRMLNYTDSQTHQAEIFEIPFKDPRYRTVFVLPYENVDVYQVLQNLNHPDLFQSFVKFEEILVTVEMPRTTVELSTHLEKILQQLNIRTMFEPAADLDKMLANKVRASVSDIVHKARMEFNEEGARGAAVSGGGIQVLSLDMDPKVVVNRPYLFFIRDTTVTDGFLFEGLVYSPDKIDA